MFCHLQGVIILYFIYSSFSKFKVGISIKMLQCSITDVFQEWCPPIHVFPAPKENIERICVWKSFGTVSVNNEVLRFSLWLIRYFLKTYVYTPSTPSRNVKFCPNIPCGGEEAKCLWTPYTHLFFRDLISYCWYNPQPMRNDHSIAVYYQHLLVSFEELLSLRLSDHFALVVGCINNKWLIHLGDLSWNLLTEVMWHY